MQKNRAAGREFTVPEFNIRYWRKQKQALQETNASRRAFRGPKNGQFPELEDKLFQYVRELRDDGIGVSHEMLRYKAKELAAEFGISSSQFKASRGWACRFVKRKGLSLRRRTSLCQRMPSDFNDKIIDFHRHVIHLRKNRGYVLSQIGNADQTPVYFDMANNATITGKGEKSVLIRTTGCEKVRCTIMLTITADGAKLLPYVIFKRKTIPKDDVPAGIHIRAQEKGWMDANMVRDWVRTVWNKRPGALLRKPSLLVWDSFRGHLGDETKRILKETKTDLAVIPGGLTSVLQPLDVLVNKPFKDSMRKLYSKWMSEGGHSLMPTGKIRRPSIGLMCTWIVEAWKMMTPDVIIKSFLKTGISNSLDGNEDDALWCTDENVVNESESEVDYSSEEESADV